MAAQNGSLWFVRRDPTSITWHIAPSAGGAALCGEERPRRGWWDAVHEEPAATTLCWGCRDVRAESEGA